MWFSFYKFKRRKDARFGAAGQRHQNEKYSEDDKKKGYCWQEIEFLNSKTVISNFDVKNFIKITVNNY